MTDKTKVDDGEPFHPFSNAYVSAGISYRQWLAGLAMQGLISIWPDDMKPNAIAHDAIKFADSLIDAEKASQG